MKINTPTGSRCLVEREEVETVTPGGIVIPGSAQDFPRRARVLMCGPEVKAIKVGDVVLTALHSGKPVDEKNPRIQLIMEENILAILDE